MPVASFAVQIETLPMPAGGKTVLHVDWSRRDSNLIAIATAPSMVLLWDISTGDVVQVPMPAARDGCETTRVAFSPLEDLLAVECFQGHDMWIIVMDVSARSSEAEVVMEGLALTYHSRQYGLAWHPSVPGVLATPSRNDARDELIRLWNVRTGEWVTVGADARTYALTWHPDGRMLASGGSAQNVVIHTAKPTAENGELTAEAVLAWEWETETHREQRGWVNHMTMNADGTRLAHAADATMNLWGLSTSKVAPVLKTGYDMAAMSFSPPGRSGTWLAFTAIAYEESRNNSAMLWNVDTDETHVLPDRGEMGVSWSAVKPSLIAYNTDPIRGVRDGIVKVLDLDTDEEIDLVGHSANGSPYQLRDVEWSPADSNRLASCSDSGEVIVWDVASATPLFTHVNSASEDLRQILSLAWLPQDNARHLLYGDRNGRVVMLDVITQDEEDVLQLDSQVRWRRPAWPCW